MAAYGKRALAFPRKRRRTVERPDSLPVEVIEDDGMLHLASLSDFDLILQALWNEFPPAMADVLPPFALQSQLYALLTDGTELGRELERARKRESLVFLEVPALRECAIIAADAFANAIRKHFLPSDASHADLVLAADRLVPACRHTVHAEDLAQLCGPERAAGVRSALLRAGYLAWHASTSDACVWSLPRIGALAKEVGAARRLAVSILRRQSFNEMPERDLRERFERPSKEERRLDWRFIERDLIGGGIVRKRAVGLGYAYVLADAEAALRRVNRPRTTSAA